MDTPGVLPGQRVDRQEAREVWVTEEADRERILKVMNRSLRGITNGTILRRQ